MRMMTIHAFFSFVFRHVFFCLAILVGVFGLCGCATDGYPVTGANPASSEATFSQSETALAVARSGGQTIVVVAYNDETDTASTIIQTPTERHALAGANHMGWSYSTTLGKTWQYGGKVTPPPGVAALWGDPALTTSKAHYNVVFMSSLAIPDNKMPAGGIFGPVANSINYIGGAVIARSPDGGKTFASHQTVSREGHFYDGGSMTSSSKGEVFAAYIDSDTHQIDVWRAPTDSSQFVLLPVPFPGKWISSHPRLRVDSWTGNLFAAAETYDGTLYMSRWDGANWTKPVAASFVAAELYPAISFASGTKLRTGPQFSFDIGAGSNAEGIQAGIDEIRVLYTARDPKTGRLYVRGSYGPTSMVGFKDAPEWGTTPGNLNTPGDQFNPNVKAWAGFFGLDPVWKATYLDRNPKGGDTVTLHEGNLAYLPGSPAKRIYVPFPLIKSMPVCPDNRGYWGDYDDLEIIGFLDGSTSPTFIRTMSDSSLGCVKKWQYTSQHLHIRAAVFK
jgi:hypothetical protein